MVMKNSRVKFKTVFLKNHYNFEKLYSKINELIKCCNIFENLSFTKSKKESGKYSSGNLSFRVKNNSFIITASSLKSKSNLKKDDFVLVKSCNLKRKLVYALGSKLPSSESMLHYAIYKKRKDVNAIFHGHFPSREFEEKLIDCAKLFRNKIKIGFTKREEEFGTLELVNSVLEVLNKKNFIVMKNHGFLSLGRNMKEAERITKIVFSKVGRLIMEKE